MLSKHFTQFHTKRQFTQFDLAESSSLLWKADDQNDKKLNDFLITYILGQGAFGRVYLAELPDVPEKYAIKSIRKDKLVDTHAIESTFLEYQILVNADHPFVCKMQYFFQTPERLYYVMPFIGGGELSMVLKTSKKFKEKQIKFYIVQLILGL